MVTETKDHKPVPGGQVKQGDVMHLPHERDESPNAQATEPAPREDMKQAASDLEQGLVDTDLHGVRGVEMVAPAPPQAAKPIPKKGHD